MLQNTMKAFTDVYKDIFSRKYVRSAQLGSYPNSLQLHTKNSEMREMKKLRNIAVIKCSVMYLKCVSKKIRLARLRAIHINKTFLFVCIGNRSTFL